MCAFSTVTFTTRISSTSVSAVGSQLIRLIGERGFDYANIFTNPDLSDPTLRVATLPERFQQRLTLVTEKSGIERRRLLHWIIAWCGLSAVWFIEDGLSPEIDFRVAELAIAELDR